MRRDPWPWHVPADLVECDSEGHLLPDWPLRRWGAAGTLACLQHPCCCDCPHAGGALRLLFSPQQQTSPIKPIPGLLQWKIQLLGHQQNHSIRTDGPWTSSMFCLLSWDDTSRPWMLAGAGDSVLLSHRPSLQSSMLSSAVCTGCVTQVCCPGKAPAKCKLSQVNSSSKLLQGELCAKIKKKKYSKTDKHFWNCISLLLKLSPVFSYFHTLILSLGQNITDQMKCPKATPVFGKVNSNLFNSVSNSILFCAWHSKHY